jgi:prephenate dehydrogenase
MWSNSKSGRPRLDQVAILGCGMIGCSFAAAIKHAGLARRVVGYSKSPTTVKTALDLGHIDQGADSAMQAVSGSDLILIAVPVAATEAMLRTSRHILTDDMIIMDVGSTKRDVAECAVRALGERGGQFVPAHPIAGKDASGPQAADPRLFRGRLTVLTPTAANSRGIVEKVQDIWESIGSTVLRMAPGEHDGALAAVSHMPHLLAFAFVNSIVRQPRSADLLQLAGTGFRDFTRIAGSDPVMWRDVFMANRDELLMQLGLFKQHLSALEASLHAGSGESIETMITRASGARRQWRADAQEAQSTIFPGGEE